MLSAALLFLTRLLSLPGLDNRGFQETDKPALGSRDIVLWKKKHRKTVPRPGGAGAMPSFSSRRLALASDVVDLRLRYHLLRGIHPLPWEWS